MVIKKLFKKKFKQKHNINFFFLLKLFLKVYNNGRNNINRL